MIYPRFIDHSFWNYKATCALVGAKYPAPPLGLITVAALLPDDWTVQLVDMNTRDLNEDDFDGVDLVMTGGMLPQQARTLELIALCKEKRTPVAVGGPDATSSPEIYCDADFRILGEAEGVIDAFVAAWREGQRSGTFTAPKFTVDVTRTPTPRYDLLNFDDYVEMGVQFSRGCPFTCEFCDIIELYGRRPRVKEVRQVIADLQSLYDLGYRGHIHFVDDNLIGNKPALKKLLPHIEAWQKERRWPFLFTTEASLNLADDTVLLDLMRKAGFFGVFIGVESPDPDVLNAVGKKQNTRNDICDSIHKIYASGIQVMAGLIVGFDDERHSLAEDVNDLIDAAAIPVVMAGLLYALPNTQLTRRLAREGRLHASYAHAPQDALGGDQCTAGLNFTTRRARAAILRDYRDIIAHAYAPENYYARMKSVARMVDLRASPGTLWSSGTLHNLKMLARLMVSITFVRKQHRGYFWRATIGTLFRNRRAVPSMMMMAAFYEHLGPFSAFVVDQIEQQIREIEEGAWTAPELVPAE